MKVHIILVAPAFSIQLNAQNVVLNSLQDAQNRALSSNIQQQQSEINQKLARTDQHLATAGYSSINFTANSEYNLNLPVQLIPSEFFGGQPGTFQEARFGRDWNSTATFDYSQPILHGAKFAQIKASKYAKEEVKFNQENQKQQILQRVSLQYLKCTGASRKPTIKS